MAFVPKNVQVFLLAPLAAVVAVVAFLAVQPTAAPARTGPAFRPTSQHVQPSSLWVGDSYTAGSGAAGPTEGEACLTAAALGWICNLDAQGGTGFVADAHANNATFGALSTRLARTQADQLADVIIVDAGRNDGTEPAADVRTAIRKYMQAIRAAWPHAKVVVVEPYFMGVASSTLDAGTLAVLRTETKRIGGVLIDPLGEGWIKPSITGKMTIKDKIHPTPAGHRYIAKHLIADLQKLGLRSVRVTDLRGAAASR